MRAIDAIDSLPLLQVPLFSLLSIWGELVEAWHGVNGHGCATAEIYSYRLQPFSPLAHLAQPSPHDLRALELSAARALVSLCLAFEAEWDCTIRIDDQRPKRWLSSERGQSFGHRCHVTVKQRP